MNSLTTAKRKPGRPREDTAGRERLLRLFEQHEGEWVDLPTILNLRIAQYNARIKQLRDEGFMIENKIEWQGRVKKSWFRFQGKTG